LFTTPYESCISCPLPLSLYQALECSCTDCECA
jgi:hypothetical protein